MISGTLTYDINLGQQMREGVVTCHVSIKSYKLNKYGMHNDEDEGQGLAMLIVSNWFLWNNDDN